MPARRCAEAARERGWDGDDEFAEGLDRARRCSFATVREEGRRHLINRTVLTVMSDEEQRTFDHLVAVIAEELSAQRGIGRANDQIPHLVTDIVWRVFHVVERRPHGSKPPGERADQG